MDIKREGEHIADIKFSGNGCALSMASASLLTEHVKGKEVSVIEAITLDSHLEKLGIEVGAVRMKCVMLPLEVLKSIVGKNPSQPPFNKGRGNAGFPPLTKGD